MATEQRLHLGNDDVLGRCNATVFSKGVAIAMSREILRDRENAFEYEFFHRVDQVLIQQLKERLQSEQRIESLSRCTGITDEAVLQELIDLDIDARTIIAISLVPLVRVAWADGEMDERERDAVLDVAKSVGLSPGSSGYQLMESWLDRCPSEKLYATWKDYMHAIFDTVNVETKERLRHELLSRARKIAEASGGVLGLHKTSKVEQATLAELEEVFAGGPAK